MAEGTTRPSAPRPRDRDRDRDRDQRGAGAGAGGKRRFHVRRKVCRFCVDKAPFIDYKDLKTLKSFITERGKILPRRISGNCAGHQRALTVAIKRGRHIAMLPYSGER
ncbi:MAG: 30S ribosomal protein S18 [Nitrospirae bacterium GWC2_57_13]|jgi:small subunit ribosomal protein S18|nr:MAG: 30S ribosomal protein S18 [Nitrospirae bacterium GWC1_57_7]OGW27961.1 MAG: 30S ribosomal protein S18 [Nitrospirae bacterium GWC2_57_13]HAS55311.1 30S ribosomal protein S18 [Nitrospiraceae bacterium]